MEENCQQTMKQRNRLSIKYLQFDFVKDQKQNFAIKSTISEILLQFQQGTIENDSFKIRRALNRLQDLLGEDNQQQNENIQEFISLGGIDELIQHLFYNNSEILKIITLLKEICFQNKSASEILSRNERFVLYLFKFLDQDYQIFELVVALLEELLSSREKPLDISESQCFFSCIQKFKLQRLAFSTRIIALLIYEQDDKAKAFKDPKYIPKKSIEIDKNISRFLSDKNFINQCLSILNTDLFQNDQTNQDSDSQMLQQYLTAMTFQGIDQYQAKVLLGHYIETLFVLNALMASSRRVYVQDTLQKLGFSQILIEMFDSQT